MVRDRVSLQLAEMTTEYRNGVRTICAIKKKSAIKNRIIYKNFTKTNAHTTMFLPRGRTLLSCSQPRAEVTCESTEIFLFPCLLFCRFVFILISVHYFKQVFIIITK